LRAAFSTVSIGNQIAESARPVGGDCAAGRTAQNSPLGATFGVALPGVQPGRGSVAALR